MGGFIRRSASRTGDCGRNGKAVRAEKAGRIVGAGTGETGETGETSGTSGTGRVSCTGKGMMPLAGL